MSETVPERLTRARDLIEEAVSILEEVGADLGHPLGATPLNIAVTHSRLALDRIKQRLRTEEEHAHVIRERHTCP